MIFRNYSDYLLLPFINVISANPLGTMALGMLLTDHPIHGEVQEKYKTAQVLVASSLIFPYISLSAFLKNEYVDGVFFPRNYVPLKYSSLMLVQPICLILYDFLCDHYIKNKRIKK